MIVVIQCASSKRPTAGHLRTRVGKPVMFVANPDAAPPDDRRVYARPDDASDTGRSWRSALLQYNDAPGKNPLGLLPAWQLYSRPTYALLANHYGVDRFYILSAGWGLIRGDFLTPNYDITFSTARNVEKFKRRSPRANYHDFRMLPTDTTDQIVFFGGKGYVSLFCELTSGTRGRRSIFYAGSKPHAPGCTLSRFGQPFTNWHYQCAENFVQGAR